MDLLVTDPLGRRLGYAPDSGAWVDEIPGALYSRPVEPDVPQLFLLPRMEGNWSVRALGLEDGEYNFGMILPGVDGFLYQVASFAGTVSVGEVLTREFNLDLSTVPEEQPVLEWLPPGQTSLPGPHRYNAMQTLPVKFSLSYRGGFWADERVDVLVVDDSTDEVVTGYTRGGGVDAIRLDAEEGSYIVNIQPEDLGLERGWGHVGRSGGGRRGDGDRRGPGPAGAVTGKGRLSGGASEATDVLSSGLQRESLFRVVVAVGGSIVGDALIQPSAPPMGPGNEIEPEAKGPEHSGPRGGGGGGKGPDGPGKGQGGGNDGGQPGKGNDKRGGDPGKRS